MRELLAAKRAVTSYDTCGHYLLWSAAALPVSACGQSSTSLSMARRKSIIASAKIVCGLYNALSTMVCLIRAVVGVRGLQSKGGQGIYSKRQCGVDESSDNLVRPAEIQKLTRTITTIPNLTR